MEIIARVERLRVHVSRCLVILLWCLRLRCLRMDELDSEIAVGRSVPLVAGRDFQPSSVTLAAASLQTGFSASV